MKMNYEPVSGKDIGYLTIHVDGAYWQNAQNALKEIHPEEETRLLEAVQLVSKPLYEAGIRHFGLTPVDNPQAEIGSLDENEALIRFTVFLPPTANVTKYTHFGLARKPAVIDEIAVNRELEKLGFRLTDEMVSAQGIPGVTTVVQYRAYTAERLKEEAETAVDAEFTNALFAAITAHTEVNVPEAMIVQEMKLMKRDLTTKLSQQGMTLQEYIAASGKDEDTFANDMFAQAKDRVVLQLAMRRIAELENITVSEEELAKRKQELAQSFHTSIEALSENIEDAILIENLRMSKVSEFLKANAE